MLQLGADEGPVLELDPAHVCAWEYCAPDPRVQRIGGLACQHEQAAGLPCAMLAYAAIA